MKVKVINYDFENIGGLLQVIAVPPTSFYGSVRIMPVV